MISQAGIRHLENERTKVAVESSGGEWKICNPNPPDLPKNSVLNPPAGSGMPMMGWGGWGWGGPAMPHQAGMQHPGMGQQMFPPMMGYPGMYPNQGLSRNQLFCTICEVQSENQEQLEQHMQTQEHKLAEVNTLVKSTLFI